MQKFIYVFCEQDRDELLSLGYTLMNQDEANNIYVFLNQEIQRLSRPTLPHLATDMLMF